MKIIINAGGKGTRRLPETRHTPKLLLPYGNKHTMRYIMHSLSYVGSDIFLVVNPKFTDMIAEHIDQWYTPENFTIIPDTAQQGPAGGIQLCKDLIPTDSPVLVVYDLSLIHI